MLEITCPRQLPLRAFTTTEACFLLAGLHNWPWVGFYSSTATSSLDLELRPVEKLPKICRGMWSIGLAAVAVFWAAWMASKLFAFRSPALKEQFYLVLYPCFLTFTAFALLTVY